MSSSSKKTMQQEVKCSSKDSLNGEEKSGKNLRKKWQPSFPSKTTQFDLIDREIHTHPLLIHKNDSCVPAVHTRRTLSLVLIVERNLY